MYFICILCYIYTSAIQGGHLMAIDRKRLVTRHNPILTAADPSSPLTVGNGGFAFTADVTGLQSLYGGYADVTPLCTMSHWGWHSFPGHHDHGEVTLTEYEFNGRKVRYAVEKKPGNEEVYDWLRQNPHRLNLGRVALLLDGREIAPEEISNVGQELCLWEGIVYSTFTVVGMKCHVMTACAPREDTLAFAVTGEAAQSGRLTAGLYFPYGSPDKTASDWEAEETHASECNGNRILRQMDDTAYTVSASCGLQRTGTHRFRVSELTFSLRFSKVGGEPAPPGIVFAQSKEHWENFWLAGGAIDLSGSADPRAMELERRIVLSQYLTAVQCAGPLPPQETGLTCNSWYGKFHLEMLPSHCAWMPLWNRGDLLRRCMDWYHQILPRARENAAKNGYAGARWPKMTGPEGIDAPSPIATLLIWQQPHIIWLLELLYRETPDRAFLQRHWPLVRETADFMADYAVYNPKRGCYELLPPLIPVQENHHPRLTRNPAFEVEYWREGLRFACQWADRLGETPPPEWREAAGKMAPAPQRDGLYLAHEDCPDTFTRYAHDHPSMLFACGMLKGERMDPESVRATLKRVLACWDLPSLWGWDFGQMAMTAVRLGLPELAVDILLMDTEKNSYVTSGNNFQRSRSDLPLYLPGNGTLLLAAGMMCAGYAGCEVDTPGFPRDGRWRVKYEDINQLP